MPMMMFRKTFALIAAALMFACVTNPETGRKSFQMVPNGMINSLGEQAYREVVNKSQISRDPRLNAIVERVARRIAAQTNVDFSWEVTLVESNEANAFVLPGGKIVVYTGILPICETEAGLAFVLGHEVGHAVAGHGNERMSQALLIQGGLTAADIAFEDTAQKQTILAALGAGATVGVLLPFSRAHESDADHMGIRYMARAGYDPSVAPEIWERMGARASGQAPPEFLSTHPSHETRSRRLRELLPETMEFYRAAPVQYGLGQQLD